MVELQVVLPDESATMPPERLVELAIAAEDLGYGTAWLPDHLLPPGEFGSTYGGVYEPLVTIGYLAARTTRIRFGTSVLVLPLRSPYVVAKQAATLHRLSGERIVLGLGAGWAKEEFAAVGAVFEERGRRTDLRPARRRRALHPPHPAGPAAGAGPLSVRADRGRGALVGVPGGLRGPGRRLTAARRRPPVDG